MSIRRTIIVRADFVAAANEAAGRTSFQGETNQETWVVPLESVDAPGTTAAFVCSWDFTATGHDPNAVFAQLATVGADETELADLTDLAEVPVDLSSRRLVVFDPDVLDHQLVLGQLGLRPPVVDD